MLGIMAFADQKDSCSDISIAGIAGDNAPRVCSWVGRPMMFNITAVMYPKDSCDMVPVFDCRKLRTLRSFSPFRSSTSLSSRRSRSPWSRPFHRPLRLPSCCSISNGRCPIVHFVQVHFPVAAQRVFPMVQTVRLTIGIPQLLNTVVHVPVELVMQVHFPVVTQRPFLMVKPVWQTKEISKLQYALGGQCSCYAGRASLVKLAPDVLVGPCTQVHGQG